MFVIGRRQFISLLGGAAATWPLAARAQQTLPVIGFLHERLPQPSPLTAAFRQGLSDAGISEGRNVTIEHRWAEGQYDRLPALAADLIERRVTVIAAAYLVAALAAKAATQTVPIVFVTGSDPVGAGLVPSLNRPASNLTGVAFMFTRLGPKNLEILRELVPNAAVIGVLVNPNNPNAGPQMRDLEAAARMLGLQLIILAPRNAAEIEPIFATLKERRIDGLLVTADGFFFGLESQLAALAARHAIPAVYPLSDYVAAGGLVKLRRQSCRIIAPDRALCRTNRQGHESRRPAGPAVGNIRARDQSADGEDAGDRRSAEAARARRQGGRIAQPGASRRHQKKPIAA
jgi:putative tryptophan/tyrosine transport system substrate-binding protein